MIRDEVFGLCVESGRLTGVSLRSGERHSANSVVLCAGCRSGELPGLPEDLRPPVRPVKGLTLRLDAGTGPRLRRTVRGLVHGRSCYLVPRADGTLVVGATVEEKGFDLSVQAGAVLELLDSARRIVPVVDEYELLETTTGLRPGSPDNGPLVGETPIAGLLVATGHYRQGILLAPLTARTDRRAAARRRSLGTARCALRSVLPRSIRRSAACEPLARLDGRRPCRGAR